MHAIELNLNDITQLFNSMDPSPFNAKDLDHDAEEFIVSWAQEYGPHEPLTFRIHLEKWPAEDPTAIITEAVHNYFTYRSKINRLEFRQLIKQGRISLAIGLTFLASCLLIAEFLTVYEGRTWVRILREGFTIAGWVSMWKPLEICLYEWWPLVRRGQILTKLGKIPVEVLRKN